MKERGIIFSGPMVRAIRDGRKTQTRRVIKAFKAAVLNVHNERIMVDCIKDADGDPSRLDIAPINWEICPYGVPGDRLYVREKWGLPPEYDPARHGDLKSEPSIGPVCYGEQYLGNGDQRPAWPGGKWRPSIYMPKWAARIWLEIVSNRVERLQDMTETDALAEGIKENEWGAYDIWLEKEKTHTKASQDALEVFRDLWDSINAKRKTTKSDMGEYPADYGPYEWDKNPWVWVIEFKRIDTERRTG